MRTLAYAALIASVPTVAIAGTACPAPEPIATGAITQPPPLLTDAPRVTAAEIAASPALTRITRRGAVLYRLKEEHGLRGVFARTGDQFRVFYLTPDDQAEIGGVMWDASGRNVTRAQVAEIPGAIPTAHWAPAPLPSSSANDDLPHSGAVVDPVARLAAAHFGVDGRQNAPRVYMIIDPLCPFSTRAFGALQPYVESGKLQLALVPVAINDHENGGASTPAAMQMLSAPSQEMARAWRRISDVGHAVSGQEPDASASAELTLNLAAAHAVKMRGTPTLIWKDKTGTSRQETGMPDDIAQFLASLPS